MALSQSALSSALQALFDSKPATTADAADGMAEAYADYAADGMFGSCVPAFTTQEAALAGTILSQGLVGTIAGFAGAWASGLAAFWAAVPVAGGGQTGATAPPVYPTLATELSAVLSSYPATTALAASQIAAVLHAATMTVTATVAPPPGTVLPIT